MKFSYFALGFGLAAANCYSQVEARLGGDQNLVNITISVSQQNLAELIENALAVSTPGNQNYGKHWDATRIEELTLPKQEDIDVITNWIKDTSTDSSYLLDNELVRVYNFPLDSAKNLPPDVAKVTDAVFGDNDSFPPEKRLPEKKSNKNSANEDMGVNMKTLAQVYNSLSAKVDRDRTDNHQMIFSTGEFGVEYPLKFQFSNDEYKSPLMKEGDENKFSFATDTYSRGPPELWGCDSAHPRRDVYTNQTEGGCTGWAYEVSSDIGLIMGMGPAVKTSLFRLNTTIQDPEQPSFNDYNPNVCRSFHEFLGYMLHSPTRPRVASISFEWPGYCSPEQISVFETRLAKIALLGSTVLAASGDHGYDDYQSSDEKKIIYPQSSPWITTVGGVHIHAKEAKLIDESSYQVWSNEFYSSGGGFNNHEVFPTPKWQENATKAYLEKLKEVNSAIKPPKGFKSNVRASPDISGISDRVCFCSLDGTCQEGDECVGGGTSYSAPAIAGIISLLNEARLDQNLPPMGFLNPFLYTAGPDAFIDVVKGANNMDAKLTGWIATEGWDAATGLGIPNFEMLKKAALDKSLFK